MNSETLLLLVTLIKKKIRDAGERVTRDTLATLWNCGCFEMYLFNF